MDLLSDIFGDSQTEYRNRGGQYMLDGLPYCVVGLSRQYMNWSLNFRLFICVAWLLQATVLCRDTISGSLHAPLCLLQQSCPFQLHFGWDFVQAGVCTTCMAGPSQRNRRLPKFELLCLIAAIHWTKQIRVDKLGAVLYIVAAWCTQQISGLRIGPKVCPLSGKSVCIRRWHSPLPRS